jgi:hypothetical protein
METYKGYELHYYPNNDNMYATFKARPYDDAEYYWAYTYDKEHWNIVYKGNYFNKNFVSTFEEVIDIIEEHNKDIKPKMIHW